MSGPQAALGELELNIKHVGESFGIVINPEEQLHERGEGIIVDLGVVEYVDKGQRKDNVHSRAFRGEPE